MQQVNIHEAKTQLSRLLEKVETEGSEIVIARNGRPIAKLVRYTHPPAPRIPGSLQGKIRIADDFDAPLPDDIAHALGSKSS